MALHDRCEICAYTEHEGSPSGIPSGINGKVKIRTLNSGSQELLCDTCFTSIIDTLLELEKDDEPVD